VAEEGFMTDVNMSDEELAELDDEAQVELLTDTEQGLLDQDQIPQPPQDEDFRPSQEGAISA
jgi:hypothetical protein